MKCPHCQHDDTRVIDSRPVEDGGALRRRRECPDCGGRFTTHERAVTAPLMVVKRDGRREEFNPAKLQQGLAKACNKRPVATEEISRIVAEVERQLREQDGAETAASRVGALVMEQLFDLDQVAYVRFASVYRQFDDVARFRQLLELMAPRTRGGDS